jgi:hypothetical protein
MTRSDRDSLPRFEFEAEILYWRGPSPFFFAPIPPRHVAELRRAARFVTYGWGMVPVEARINGVAFQTSLFPKDEGYLLPIKAEVRRKTNITAGDSISVEMEVQPSQR